MCITAGGNSPTVLWTGVVSIVSEPSQGASIVETCIIQERGLQGFPMRMKELLIRRICVDNLLSQ